MSQNRAARVTFRRFIVLTLAWLIAAPLNAQPAKAQQAPIRIGVLEDMSGLYMDVTGMGSVVAARMAAFDAGMVLGRRVEIVSADHQNKADIGGSIARDWYDNGNVSMITGLGNSSVAVAVRSLSKDRGKVDIVTSAGSADLTGKFCAKTGFHWVYDTYETSKVMAAATIKNGGKTWFFMSADYAFGAALQDATTSFVKEAGGEVLGAVKIPLNTADFSSFLLQAQQSGAKVIGLANAGQDTVNSVKQANEFGLVRSGQSLAALVAFVQDIRGMGLPVANGLLLTEAFYWDQDDATRAWSRRFFEERKAMPNSMQAGVYSAIRHYLNAVAAAGTLDGDKVAETMRATPINDFFSHAATIRADGRVIRDVFLLQAKKPEESQGPWDLLKIVATVPGQDAFRPLSQSACPFVTAAK